MFIKVLTCTLFNIRIRGLEYLGWTLRIYLRVMACDLEAQRFIESQSSDSISGSVVRLTTSFQVFSTSSAHGRKYWCALMKDISVMGYPLGRVEKRYSYTMADTCSNHGTLLRPRSYLIWCPVPFWSSTNREEKSKRRCTLTWLTRRGQRIEQVL